MIRKNIIRSLFSLVLILLFAFSITPKKTLHDIFGCHPESTNTGKFTGKEKIAAKGFHCSCQQPELQAPFLQQPVVTEPALPTIFFPTTISSYTTALYERAELLSALRGPPSLG